MGVCAYCNGVSRLTKEHIWPKSLIQKNATRIAYSSNANKFFSGEPVIRDVCALCNNAKLSDLDEYISSLFDRSFVNIVNAGDGVDFSYTYELLLRVILKISYNSSRASGTAANARAHIRFVKYVLNGGYAPKAMLRLQIVTSSRLIDLRDKSEREFVPQLLRCGEIAYDGPLSNRFMLKLVAINSYWFYLIVPFKDEPPHKWKEMLNGFAEWRLQPGVVVAPNQEKLHVPANQTTYFDLRLLGSLLGADRT